MKASGITLTILLVLAVFSIQFVEAKPVKTQIKKDIKDLNAPLDAKSAKIISISKPRTLHIWHIVGVQVCAGAEKLYSPDLELRSDRDVVQVTMWGLIMPKTCKSGEFFIAANNPDTISVSFSNQSFREPAK
ncbi:hypothetical protein [Candidatus Nitrosotenuis aquarius]|uniref:hypothetical protein n=1 Tax=Candidatus Nitrosotenuis aquarius TaxID=1846278 RepID=UPI000C1F80E0|nr:hypothetical protein [Candidatus Nitrosotenuis aquarius]